MIQELQELGFHTESVPTSLSEVMASIQVLCRELVEVIDLYLARLLAAPCCLNLIV